MSQEIKMTPSLWWQGTKHCLKWNTQIGGVSRGVVTWFGILAMRFARKCFK